MGFSLTSPAPEKCDPTAKNRVWGFFGEQPETSRPNRPQSLQPRRENRPATTKVASGRTYWPSRDPIGENGGINLYGMVGNDAVNWWDFLGQKKMSLEDLGKLVNGGVDALTPGTYEVSLPLGGGFDIFANFIIKEKDQYGCRAIEIAVGINQDIKKNVAEKGGKIFGKIPVFGAEARSAVEHGIKQLPGVSASFFIQGGGKICDCCVDFCEVSVGGAITIGEGRRGGGEQNKMFGIGISGEVNGTINFCTGEYSIGYTFVASVSLNLAFDNPLAGWIGPDMLIHSWNRDFESGGNLLGPGQSDRLKILKECKVGPDGTMTK